MKDCDCISRFGFELPDFTVNFVQLDVLRQAQQKDISHGSVALSERMLKDQEEIVHFVPSGVMDDVHTKLVYVPEELRFILLESVHSDLLSGHVGFEKVWYKLCTRFYWPGMKGCASFHQFMYPVPNEK